MSTDLTCVGDAYFWIRKHYDSRTRRDRLQKRIDAWRSQTKILASHYMDWKHMNDTDISYNGNSWQIDVVSFSCECWHRVLVSLTQFYTDFGPHEFKEIDGASHSNETLVRQGFLGASPEKPSLAFSIELLEIYQQLRRVCPRFSLDALARALCHIHRVRISPFDRY